MPGVLFAEWEFHRDLKKKERALRLNTLPSGSAASSTTTSRTASPDGHEHNRSSGYFAQYSSQRSESVAYASSHTQIQSQNATHNQLAGEKPKRPRWDASTIFGFATTGKGSGML